MQSLFWIELTLCLIYKGFLVSIFWNIYKQKQNKGSYRVRNNLAKGLDLYEGKNTKITLELLQQLHYKDINQSQPDDFSPDRFVTDPEDSGDDDSVFDCFFPGSKKKKPKANKKGENYSERIMNIK